MSRREHLWLAVASAALIAIGCAKGTDARRDTAAAPPAIGGANANPIDTGMAAKTPDSAGAHRDTTHAAPKKP